MSAIIDRDEWTARQQQAPECVRRLLARKAQAKAREDAAAAARLAADEERCRGHRAKFEAALTAILAGGVGEDVRPYRVRDDKTGLPPFTADTREYRAVFDLPGVGLHPIHVILVFVPAAAVPWFPASLQADTWQPVARPFVVFRPDGTTRERDSLDLAVEDAAEYVSTPF